MKTDRKTPVGAAWLAFLILKLLISVLLGTLLSQAAVFQARGAYLPAAGALLSPLFAASLLAGGVVGLAIFGIDAGGMAFLAASLMIFLLKPMYGGKDKHKYPLVSAAAAAFTVFSGRIAAGLATSAGFGFYVTGAALAALCGASVFVFAGLKGAKTDGRISPLERSRLIPAEIFVVAALSSFQSDWINPGAAFYIFLCLCAMFSLKRHEAAVFCAVTSMGLLFGGEIPLMGIATACVIFRPKHIGKNRLLGGAYMVSMVMLFSLLSGETQWLAGVISTLIGVTAFSAIPKNMIMYFIGTNSGRSQHNLQGAANGKGIFLSNELEKLALRVSMCSTVPPSRPEDAVYTGICINCERFNECFDDGMSMGRTADEKHFCAHFDEVMSLASKAGREIKRYAAEEDRSSERRKIFSCALAAASEAARESSVSVSPESERVRAALEDFGVGCSEIRFSPDGSCEMYYPAKARIGKNRVSSAISTVFDGRLSYGEQREIGGTVRLTYLPKRRFAAEYSVYGISKEENSPTGDGVRSFEKGIYKYILLSDGMGTGKNAAEYSLFLLESIEGLIRAGYSEDTAILLASQAMVCSIGEEGFATLNMAKINLVSGRIDFYSCGEGNSYIFDGELTSTVPGGGYPLGVLDEPSVSRHSVSCKDSEYLIMLTDGGSLLDEKAVGNFLDGWKSGMLSELSEAICSAACSLQTSKSGDDITVIAVKVEKLY